MQAQCRPATGRFSCKRFVSVLGLAILATLALAPAADASLLDPLLTSCHPNDIQCTVTTTVEGSISTVNEITEPVVRHVVEQVEETVSTVEKVVEETVIPVLPSQTPGAPDRSHGPGITDPGKGRDKESTIQGVRRRQDPITRRATVPNALSTKTVQDLQHSSSQSVAGASGRAIDRGRGFTAREIASKLAFPMLLTLLFGMFLMVQSRIDRREAKLVLAPIQTEEELLSFQ